jgi:hypothetical protein
MFVEMAYALHRIPRWDFELVVKNAGFDFQNSTQGSFRLKNVDMIETNDLVLHDESLCVVRKNP